MKQVTRLLVCMLGPHWKALLCLGMFSQFPRLFETREEKGVMPHCVCPIAGSRQSLQGDDVDSTSQCHSFIQPAFIHYQLCVSRLTLLCSVSSFPSDTPAECLVFLQHTELPELGFLESLPNYNTQTDAPQLKMGEVIS